MAASGEHGLHRLVYASTAAEPLFADRLDRILLRARVANRERGVSGLLLFREGRFFQVLEGPRRTVNDLYSRIARDRTHRDLTLIEDGPCTSRLFGDAPLAYLAARYFTPEQREALRVLSQLQSGMAPAHASPAEELLGVFRGDVAA